MRFMKNSEVCQMIGISRTTLWRMVSSGEFPPSFDLRNGMRRWHSGEVEAWMNELRPAKPQLIVNAELPETIGNAIKQQNRQKQKAVRNLATD